MVRPTFIIRLSAPEPEALTEYCVAPPDASQSWPVACAPFSEVLAIAAGHRVAALLPTDDVRIEWLDLPVKQASKALQAARYALEELLADDVDDLHFAIGNRQATGGYPIAIMTLARFDTWRTLLLNANLNLQSITPEGLLIPTPTAERWYGLVEHDRAVIRHQPWACFSATTDTLDSVLDLADPERQQALTLLTTQDARRDCSTIARPVELRSGFVYGLEALLPQLAGAEVINLLQGAYAPQESYERYWRPWRLPTALAATLLIIVGAQHAVAASQLGRQVAEIESRNIASFQQLFPGQTRIVDLAAQAEQQYVAQRNRQGGDGVLFLMGALSGGLAAVDGLTLQGLQYRDSALVVSLTGTSLQQLETLRGEFGQRTDVRLEVQSANAGAEGVQIRLRLTAA